MAGSACLRRRLIEQDFLTFDELNLLVALHSWDVLVRALQREHRLLVIEERRPPLGVVVALRAASHVSACELGRVWIFVAVFTLLRCMAEIHVLQCHFEVRWAMTFGAANRPVRAGQHELCRRMIERRDLRPRFRRVAEFTTFRAGRSHSFLKLPSMRIDVTCRARETFEMERCSDSRRRAPVTITANDSRVTTRQLEGELLVHRERKGRWLETLNRMTRLALSEIWRVSKLLIVIVLMTGCTSVESDFVQRGGACRNVALRALQGGVLPDQRVTGGIVIDRSELDLLKSLHGVARFAFAPVSALRELALVRILVAIAAEPE